LWSFFLLTQAGLAQSPKAGAIDALLKPFVEAGHFSGVVLAVENGRLIYEKAFGLANAEFNIPNQVDTRIGIASITKSMSAVILTRLIEERRIAAGDKLAKYIPDFPDGDKITIEMLARHRSGIPHRVMKPEEESLPHTSAEMVERIKKAALAFEPGAQSLYSSAGYTVLARAMELAAGKTYAQLLQEYVFAPAGLTDSLDFDGEKIMERHAQDYLLDASGMINAALKDYSFLVGAGSVFSTARDVYRFGEAIMNGTFGESVRSSQVRDGIISSNGSTNGHRAFLKINVTTKNGYVLLSNLNCGANDLILSNLEAILEGKEGTKPSVPQPKIIPNPNKDLSEFAGRYQREGGGTTEISNRGDLLVSDGANKFYPIRPDCFFEYKYYGEVCFVRDDSGRIKGLEWTGPGYKLTWVRQ
jgi:CubicO group peptidase (beta-lactamase class C family)